MLSAGETLKYCMLKIPLQVYSYCSLVARRTATGGSKTYMNPVVFSTGFSACRRYIFGSCRRRSTWFDDLRFCVYESCARSRTQKRNYTRKDFFRNRVYENYASKPVSGEKLYMEGLFRKSCLWKSKSDADFRCQSPIKYTRFKKKNVRAYFTCRCSISGRKSIYTIFEKSISCPVVTVRARRCLHPRLIFMRRLCRASLFVFPPHSTAFIYLHIGPAPCKQTKKSTIFSLCTELNYLRFSNRALIG